MRNEDYYGIVLAGGTSSRMGTDKAAIRLNGRTFLEIQVEKLKNLGLGRVLVSCPYSGPTNDADLIPDIMYVPDLLPERGPLGGLYSCFLRCEGHPAIVLSVDVPRISAATLRALMKAYDREKVDGVVLSYNDRPEPLLAVYNTGTREVIKELLDMGELPVLSYLASINCCRFPFKGDPEELINCNTPEELRMLKSVK